MADAMDEFFLTPHFLGRAVDMGITPEQIRAVLTNPEFITASTKYKGKVNYRRGELSFGVDPIPRNGQKGVLTAVWTTDEAWERDMSKGEYGNRSLRKAME